MDRGLLQSFVNKVRLYKLTQLMNYIYIIKVGPYSIYNSIMEALFPSNQLGRKSLYVHPKNSSLDLHHTAPFHRPVLAGILEISQSVYDVVWMLLRRRSNPVGKIAKKVV